MPKLDVVKVLVGHVDEETAYLIEDYPYGRRLRCQKLVWVETKPRHGQRVVYRTTNPKKHRDVPYPAGHPLGDMYGTHFPLNKPKLGTYNDVVVMYLDSDGYVQFSGIHTPWATSTAIAAFIEKFRPAMAHKYTAETLGYALLKRTERDRKEHVNRTTVTKSEPVTLTQLASGAGLVEKSRETKENATPALIDQLTAEKFTALAFDIINPFKTEPAPPPTPAGSFFVQLEREAKSTKNGSG